LRFERTNVEFDLKNKVEKVTKEEIFWESGVILSYKIFIHSVRKFWELQKLFLSIFF